MQSFAALGGKFAEVFGGVPRLFRAPGRVNLIGEHTDYNEGWVLPMAIDRSCFVLGRARNDDLLRFRSAQFEETVEHSLDSPPSPRPPWAAYPLGVARALREGGHKIGGADLLISSEVPIGAGLSSSAALEVATGFALLSLAGEPIDRVELARTCQRAENDYVGMRCGIMDQLTACCAQRGHALLIDCRTLAVTPEFLDDSQVSLVVANTMVKHELAASAYNRRRAECEDAVTRIRALRPAVGALRDVTWPEIEGLATSWPDPIRRRARHVTTENARVHASVAALHARDFARLGRLFSESHASLDADYQVSSPELNLMVRLAEASPHCFGARMTGGGFGGCTVNLVRAGGADDFISLLAETYYQASGIRPDVYPCRASGAAEEIR